MDSNEVVVLDIRVPCVPAATLVKHKAPVNGMVWAPHSSCHVCTASDDAMAVIWDVRSIPKVRGVDNTGRASV
jgi:WD repeat-containing protein 68